MNDARLLELLARTDPFPVDAPLLDAVRVPAIALHEIERRIEVQTQERPEVATPSPPGRNTGRLIANGGRHRCARRSSCHLDLE
jgi:hypothetical protein